MYHHVPKLSTHPEHTNRSSGNHPGNRQNQQLEQIFSSIQREASAINLYRQLANVAPNQQHKKDILQALEVRKAHLKQFTNLYMYFCGRQPEYRVNNIPILGYYEGLQSAYKGEVEDYEEYHRYYSQTEDRYMQNVFLWALQGEQINISKLNSILEDETRQLMDYGSEPFVIDIEKATKQNNTFRTALWTGEHLQLTLMSININEDIGLEVHPHLDQFLRIEEGQGLVQMGDHKDQLDFQAEVFDDYSIFVPAGKWHNLTNTGNKPIKLYSIYAPPEHPYGTVHQTKAEAMAAEEDQYH
ncbi:mannose-6-phosphate isomerase [Halalkalibacter wakoensis JCM 9140]|uniref:Mannose-6-phosphate isomerase n=1 Tax=Halalkalibacter wakoensis JCM 9140 TaxID=1236970 RepID=W4PZS2_9BACI|nr:cupin domain-containing protein [Halalkalibacter wakoensis]GAE24933.1 mannose-6-phosphate isomerase [Halalkalibacter wakoensis JCM 9140]